MLYFPQTRILNSIEYAVAPGAQVNAEGTPLVASLTGGQFGVQPCAGATGEKFVGVSIAQQLTPLYLPFIDEGVPGASLFLQLSNTPISGTILVLDTTTGATLTASSSSTPGAGEYYLNTSANQVVVNSAQENDTIEVFYRYSPSTLQAQALQGMIPAGGSSSLLLNSVGVIVTGLIMTSEWDTSVSWAENDSITLGANGLFTTNGSGTAVNAYITALPTNSLPFLGLFINAGQ